MTGKGKGVSNYIYEISIVVSALFALVFVNYFHKIQELRALNWDGAGYYIYLPAFFIYKNLKQMPFLHDLYSHYEISSYVYAALKYDNGNYVMPYTMGVAFMQLPFFALSHLIANLWDFPADGFSLPYQWGMFFGGLFYTLTGCLILFQLLRQYFIPAASCFAVISILLGTNLYYYGVADNSMTHCYLFFLVASLLWLTNQFYKRATFHMVLMMGVAAGMIALIRPTSIIIGIVVLLWKVNSVEGFKQNLRYLIKHWGKIIVAVVVASIPFSVQCFYWHYVTGYWFFNSYAYTGQGFDFLHPHILGGIFSFENGWLIYSPLLILSFIGFLVNARQLKSFLPAFVLYLMLQIWIVFSWWSYHYGGFGLRAMIESYAVLAFPLTSLYQSLIQKRNLRWALILPAMLIVISLHQSWQYMHDLRINNWYEYKQMFGKMQRDFISKNHLDKDGRLRREFVGSVRVIFDSTYQEPLVSRKSDKEFLGVDEALINNPPLRATQRLSFSIETKFDYIDPIGGTQAWICISLDRKGKQSFQKYKPIPRSCVNQYETTTVEMQVPPNFQLDEKLTVFLWNFYDNPLRVRRMKVELITVKE